MAFLTKTIESCKASLGIEKLQVRNLLTYVIHSRRVKKIPLERLELAPQALHYCASRIVSLELLYNTR